jgi:hypothetical protein
MFRTLYKGPGVPAVAERPGTGHLAGGMSVPLPGNSVARPKGRWLPDLLPAYGGQESDCIAAAFGDIPGEGYRHPSHGARSS